MTGRMRRWRARVAAVLSTAFAATACGADLEPTASVAEASAAVIDALRARDITAIEARFAPSMREVLPHDRFAATLDRIFDDLGALGACDALRAQRRDATTAVETRCEFRAMPMNLRMAWTESMQLTGLLIVPVPAPPAQATLPQGVSTESPTTGARGWPLPATLLVPSAVARPPVVVLVHGSGPNDRDETIGPNRPLLDLAVGLAARGIASLRYDKRTRALGERFVAELPDYTLDDEIVDDAVAAVALVASRADLGPVVIVGHSEGAWLAPRIAAAAAANGVDVADIVMLAAPLTPVADLLVDQYEFLSRLPSSGVTPAMAEEVKRRRANVVRLVQRAASGAEMPAEAHDPLPLDAPPSLWLDMGRYDPIATLAAQPRLPALLTFGERDFQVPIREKALWEGRLRDRARTTIVSYPELNHLLIDGAGPMSPAEYRTAGHVSAALIDRVASWIGDRTAMPGR